MNGQHPAFARRRGVVIGVVAMGFPGYIIIKLFRLQKKFYLANSTHCSEFFNKYGKGFFTIHDIEGHPVEN